DLDPKLGLFEYERLYTGDPNNIPQPVRQVMSTTVGKHIVLIQATTNADVSSDAARNIVKAIRADNGVVDARLLVGGPTAIDVDVITFIYNQVPLAVGTVFVFTSVMLLLVHESAS